MVFENDEALMTNDESSSNDRMTNEQTQRAGFVIGILSFLRHSSLVIRH
jgi:hypothetical protein